MEIIHRRFSLSPQIMISLLEVGMMMLPVDHTQRPLVAMMRMPPIMNGINTLMSVGEILFPYNSTSN